MRVLLLAKSYCILAASIVFIQCILAVLGILVSDILLAIVDPRIKFDSK